MFKKKVTVYIDRVQDDHCEKALKTEIIAVAPSRKPIFHWSLFVRFMYLFDN